MTHEAPGGDGMHPHGFEAIGQLAELLGVKKALHGHHHEARLYPVGPVQWMGVDMGQIVDLNGNAVGL